MHGDFTSHQSEKPSASFHVLSTDLFRHLQRAIPSAAGVFDITNFEQKSLDDTLSLGYRLKLFVVLVH